MDKVRKLAGDLLTRITKEGAYSGAVLDQALSSAALTEQDRAFVTELVYGSVARLYSIDEIIKAYSKVKISKMEDTVLSALRIAIYQIRWLDRVPPFAAVSEAVTMVGKKSPKAAGFVNGILRAILREEKTLDFRDETARLSFQYSLKPELTRHFQKEYPHQAEQVLMQLMEPEGLSIRVNERRISRSDYEGKLTEAGIAWSPGWFSPLFLYLNRQGAVRSLPGFTEGWFSVQNEAAGLPPLIMAKLLESGQVLDLCAAPGGKSAALAEQGGDALRVTAFDLNEKKLRRMEENFQRLGLDIRTRAADATVFLPEFQEQAAGVLLDVPCSGLGLLGRKPDIRLHMDLKGMAELKAIQRAILSNGSRYLSPGGILIYSTCTLNRAENEDNVREFLETHSGFHLLEEPVLELKRAQEKAGIDNLLVREGMVTILPGRGLDGFFLAVLKKEE